MLGEGNGTEMCKEMGCVLVYADGAKMRQNIAQCTNTVGIEVAPELTEKCGD